MLKLNTKLNKINKNVIYPPTPMPLDCLIKIKVNTQLDKYAFIRLLWEARLELVN